MTSKLVLAAGLFFTPLFHAQQQLTNATLTFHFQRAGLPVPTYTFTLHEDGTGTYVATYTGPAVPPASRFIAPAEAAASVPSVDLTRPILLTAPTTAQLFQSVRSTHLFRSPCESRAKNIADSGAKTLTYAGPDGSAQCTYNYTENKAIASVTDTFEGIAQTLDEGRSIDLKHRFDRLGLDQELANLADAVRTGRALEVATIAPILQSLTEDPQVMERVRKRAAGLLQASAPAR